MNRKNRHHIIPQSRLKGRGISAVCYVDEKIHNLSHALFGNMTPEEIVEWLNKTLWHNNYHITIKRKE